MHETNNCSRQFPEKNSNSIPNRIKDAKDQKEISVLRIQGSNEDLKAEAFRYDF